MIFLTSKERMILALWSANTALLVYANWRDGKNDRLTDQDRKLGKRAFVTVVVGYVLLVAGPIASNLSGFFEKSWTVFLLLTLVPWLIALVCALAGLAFGMGSKGWNRIAAIVSSTVMIGFMACFVFRGRF
jgi:cytochrome bd-type quinol oxidase subunit 2